MLWQCEQCGCRGIAASLLACPHCFADRPPVVHGTPAEAGASAADVSASGAAETGTDDAAPEQDEPVTAATAPHGDAGSGSDSIRVARRPSRTPED